MLAQHCPAPEVGAVAHLAVYWHYVVECVQLENPGILCMCVHVSTVTAVNSC
jgi:hypothetical protein